MHSFQYLALLALVGLSGLSLLTNTEAARDKKLLSVFNIVTFNNDPCNANNNKNGTCYTAQECEDKGGVASGSCAESYGVCCTISIGCGETSSENCTYIELTNPSTGNCKTTVCPCNNNICQLRLDFNSFVISGPSTSTQSIAKTVNGGVVLKTGTKAVSQATQCLTDTFSVSSDGYRPPTICGTNTGEHMYVDSDRSCNELDFGFGANGVGNQIAGNREINIKVTQIGCNHPNKAPPGCTQYFYGAASDVIKTFNYDGGSHLANQDQNICIRREKGNCAVCYAAVTTMADFMLSGMTTAMTGKTNKSGQCCGYGSKGTKTSGYDCVQIPGVIQKVAGTALPLLSAFCGRALATIDAMMSMTVCQKGNSFNLRFLSDQWEFGEAAPMENAKPDIGFRLAYTQQSC